MAQDIRIDNDQGHFKLRVAGILQQNGKILANIINQNDFYCFAGGHVELGETLDHAIKREMEEELGFEVKIERPIFIVENFYTKNNEKWHEICCYYLLSSAFAPKEDWELVELDKGVQKRQQFKWLTPNDIAKVDFKPALVKSLLLELDKPFRVITHKDN